MATRTRPELAALKARPGRVRSGPTFALCVLDPTYLKSHTDSHWASFPPPAAKTDFGDRYYGAKEAATEPSRQKPTRTRTGLGVPEGGECLRL